MNKSLALIACLALTAVAPISAKAETPAKIQCLNNDHASGPNCVHTTMDVETGTPGLELYRMEGTRKRVVFDGIGVLRESTTERIKVFLSLPSRFGPPDETMAVFVWHEDRFVYDL